MHKLRHLLAVIAPLLATVIISSNANARDAKDSHSPIRFSGSSLDLARLPAAVRNVPLSHLSSGALLRLDRGGDLVEIPAARAARVRALVEDRPQPTGGLLDLDPRVGANIRLGDDPAVLPPNMRAQAEPHIARSPTNADVVLATFQEGRFASGGGAADCGYAISQNGGLTWTRALIPGLTHASGGSYLRATDPVAAVARNGDLFLNTIGSTDATFDTGAVLVSRSTDGGATFAPPSVVYQSPDTSILPDKNWIAINTFPGTPASGRIVVMFSYFTSASTNGASIVSSFSDNGGSFWSPLNFVNGAAADSQGAQPLFLATGKLAVVYWNFNGTADYGDDFMQVAISTNGGNTFGPPKLVTHVNVYNEPQIRNGVFLPSAATDRTTGNIYVAYQGRTAGGAPKIFFTKSANAGDTWTTPIAISDNPATAGVFNPAIAASDDGQTLTATFYDHRSNPGSNTLVDLYLAQSLDGGATWQPNIRVSATSTDAALAPLTSQGYMLGDYLGLAGAANANVPSVPVWIDTRTGNPDPFVARVGIAAQVDFTSWQAAHLSLGQINNPATGGEAGDADGDGEDNLAEFHSRTDPNDPASIVHTARQLNISTRTRVEGGDHVLIGGFIIRGTAPKQILARGLGPSLTARGVPGAMQDPTLELVPASGASTTNDNWQDDNAAAIQATGIPPEDPRESAIVQTLAPGEYTAILRSKTDAPGVGLVELYELNAGDTSQFANLSSRGLVGTDDNVMIGGFIVGRGQGSNGDGSVRVALRGIGPSLGTRGVTDPLQDPVLSVYDANGDLLSSNDNWRSGPDAAELQRIALAPTDDLEAALILSLVQGNYTAIVRGHGQQTGVALVEVFDAE